MRVRITLTLDVDADAYREEYDDPTISASEIRESIRSAIATAAATDGIVVPAGIIRSVDEA